MVYCNSLEPVELPSRSKSVETPGEFGSITTQPHAAGFLAKLCAVPRGTGSSAAQHSLLPLHTSALPAPCDHTQLVEDIVKSG